MDYSVRIRNANMVMGNIKEMNYHPIKNNYEDNEKFLDILFAAKNYDGFDFFDKCKQ